MRIPSQFNQDNLYRQRSGPVDSVQSYRRLVRMILGLVLIIVLMQQASRPEVYRTFFRAPDPLAAATQLPAADQALRRGPATAEAESPLAESPLAGGIDESSAQLTEVRQADRTIAVELVTAMTLPQQKAALAILSRWRHRTDSASSVSEPSEKSFTSLVQSLESESLPEPVVERWSQLLNWLDDQDSSLSDSDDVDSLVGDGMIDRGVAEALWRSLDEAATQRVVDGSVWNHDDFDAFYQYLNQAPALPVQGVAATGVLPLLQQPDVFRGQSVRVGGQVARAEHVTASSNPYGIKEYWQLWLKPEQGVQRPIVAIVPSVDQSIVAAAENQSAKQVPVVVVGRYLKRLAYQSSIGADLAPVVVGRAFGPAPVAVRSPVQSATDRQPIMATVIVAVLIGLLIAVVVFWRTRVNEARSRRLRYAHRNTPSGFLEEIAGPSEDQ